MLYMVVLAVSWLILLLRYPSKALPISLAAGAGLLLLAAWVVWEEQRHQQRLTQLSLALTYTPERCPSDRPLSVHVRNHSTATLRELSWKVSAWAPMVNSNLLQSSYPELSLPGPLHIAPGDSWEQCVALPPLRPGYRASTVQFRAEQLRGRFEP